MKTNPILITKGILIVVLVASLAACNRLIPTADSPTPTPVRWESPTASPSSQTVLIEATEEPTATAEPTATPTPSPTPSPEPTQVMESTPTEPPAPTPTPAQAETAEPTSVPSPPADEVGPPLTHVVRPGENLYRISLEYGVGWHELAAANQLPNPNVIFANQALIIPTEQEAQTIVLPATHVVQPGENLYRIGRQYGRPWDAVARANNIVNPNRVYVGQQLSIPAEDPLPPSLPATHTVQPGENLFRIGLYYGVPWPTIAQANGIVNPHRIWIGTTLTIPTAED